MTRPTHEIGARADRNRLEQQYHEQLQRQLRETDRLYTERLCRRYRDLVPPERIRAMQDLPTVFEDRKQFEQSYLHAAGEKPTESVVGFSRGTVESAHVATDHVQMRKTIIHERLHQLADPTTREQLGSGLTEGITEDLAIRELGSEWNPELIRSYPEQRALAQQMREACGDQALNRVYFEGDTTEIRACLDGRLGGGSLDRLREMADRALDDERSVETSE